jgi:hypothetical protein
MSNNCKYCNGLTNDFIPLNDTADYSGVEIAFHHKGILRARYNGGQDIVMLKVCPVCGKEIKDE